MLRPIFTVFLIVLISGKSLAQDTIVFHGQPDWKKGLDIADHCYIFEPVPGKKINIDQIKQQVFVPFTPAHRKQKLSNQPEIIQWLKFTLQNTHATDTLALRLNLSPHYYTRLYNQTQLLASGGAYHIGPSFFDRFALPFKVPPAATITFWVRTEDRNNQLVPPGIRLETPYTYMHDVAQTMYAERLLFLFLAIMAGCLLFTCLYAGYQYYLTRDASTGWYIFYALSCFLTGLFWLDIRHQLQLFGPVVRDIILAAFGFLIPVLYSLFIGSILHLSVHFKKSWVLVKVLIVVALLQITVGFIRIRTGWFFLSDAVYPLFLSLVPVFLLHCILLVLTALSKSAVKWFLFTGLLALTFLLILPPSGIISYYGTDGDAITQVLNFVPFFIVLGLTIEAVCFSFSLVYRSKLILIEKNQLQEHYARQLEEKLIARTDELAEKNRLAEEQKLQQAAAEFERKIAETEMTALRAQMNPHFIFNCLNSIKLYTLENDSKTASEYLTIFSQLIRRVLENSQSEKITLQKELETLRLYLELEAMRFKNKVQYQINVASVIDAEYIKIPPLLLQPYVENAIWHGLMHKKEGGHISIDVFQPTEQVLFIQIVDDGIGRKLAAEIQSKSATQQKSFGLKLTSDRIHIINQLYQIQTDVTVEDLKDETNMAIGTKVIIQIPI